MNLLNYNYFYFVGAGGIGMSALERFLLKSNKIVLGYDKDIDSVLVKELMMEGVDINFIDDIKYIPSYINRNNTLVIYTPAILANENNILYFFISNNFNILKRAEFLGILTSNSFNICIAGTHGKTTTSAILGHTFYDNNFQSTSFIGGILIDYNSNMLFKGNKYIIVEADEYDKSFLKLNPNIGLITSCDIDHLDVYRDKDDLIKSFKKFSENISDYVLVHKSIDFINGLTYGSHKTCDFYCYNLRYLDGKSIFNIRDINGSVYEVDSYLHGYYNMENITAAFSICNILNINADKFIESIKKFKGIKRRFNVYKCNNKIYIDDYAHHPTEIDSLINAIRFIYNDKKILGIFQPHLFSRTRDLMSEFSQVLSKLDYLILFDIYPAREKPIPNINSKVLYDKVKTLKIMSDYSSVLDDINTFEFDILVTIGAGDIYLLSEKIKNKLSEM